MSELGPTAEGVPTREEVDRSRGQLLLEFGADWCPHYQAIQAALTSQKTLHPDVRHIAVEDGPGRPLGRSFRVKLWPTLVFLTDGQVIGQLVRPTPEELAEGFAAIAAARPD